MANLHHEMNAVHFTRLDLNLLLVFRALMLHRNVTRASEVLNLTPSAVSHALARLRNHYGDALFIRMASGMNPTARATEISRTISDALEKIESTFVTAFNPATLQKEFRIGLVNFDALYLLPALMGKLASEAPMAKIAVEHLTDETLGKHLNGPNLDLVIGVVPIKRRSWNSESVFVDQLCVIASADHPDIGDTISREQYQNAAHVRIPSMAGIDALIARQGIRQQFALSVNDFLSALFAVARSENVAVVPSNVARIYEKICNLKRLPLPVSIPAFAVDLVYHNRHAGDLAHAWLRESIRSVASELKKATERSSGA